MIFNTDKRQKRHLRAAEGFLSLGMPDHALDALKQISDPAEATVDLYLLRGDALRAKQEHELALACFQQAHELSSTSLEALMGMAWCHKRLDRLDQSIDCMRQAYQAHPTIPVVLYNMACYYSLAGNKEQALSWLGRALRMSPSLGKLVADESDFDPLRDDPDLKHLLTLLADR
jgi:tetratricopeptide (TPR) repeat protein